MLGQQNCLMAGHDNMQIQGICQSKYCREPQRKICFQCIKDHKKNDQFFDISDIKSEQEIQLIINEFKQSNSDRMNLIALQLQIQQYILNVEIIEQVKLWNYKYNEIHQIMLELQNFNNSQWNQISLHHYLNNEKKNISINEYMEQYLQKLFYIDDLKNDYIKNQVNKIKYNEIVNGTKNIMIVNTEQNKLSIYIVEKINKYKNQLFENITSNYIFQKNKYQNEDYIITICELMIRQGKYKFLISKKQGYDLKTDAIVDKFEALIDKILDNTVQKYKYLYIQGYAIAYKQKIDEQQRSLGLQLINQSLEIKNNSAKSLRIKGLFYFDFKMYEEAIKMYDEAIKIDPKYIDAYNNKGATLHCLQQYQQSIEMYDEAIKIDPKFAAAYCNKGLLFNSLQKYQSAIQIYEDAIKIDPRFADAYYGKGNSLYNLQKYQQAIEMYDEAIRVDPKFADAYFNKANSFYQLKQYNLSRTNFEKYLDFYPNDEETKYRISNELLTLEKCDKYIKI